MDLCKICLVFLFFALFCLSASGCDKKAKTTLVYSNDFESGKIGDEWKREGGHWEVVEGKLHSKSAKNKDLVLTQALPPEALIELDMISHSPQVDIKIRAWGDIRSDLHDGAYHFILGGWGNKISTIAPLGEHDERRVEKREALQSGRWYHVAIERRNGRISLSLDGKPYLVYEDKAPLDPKIYKYFSFANWKTNCEFDNLKISRFD